MEKLVSILIITINRKKELFEVLNTIKEQKYYSYEILIAENGSSNNIIKYHQERLKEFPGIKYYILPKNLGVSGGRNFLLKRAKGDVIIEIDDDALLVKNDSISKVVNYFEENPTIGIQAFKSINYYTKTMDRIEFPFRDKKIKIDSPRECTWFIGVGHAFTKELINTIGIYRDFYPWGSEEQDYSLRAIDAGYRIVFRPDIRVLHKKSPRGRIDNLIEFKTIALKNRIKVAALNLPWYSILTYLLIRGIQTAIVVKNPAIIFYALKKLYLEKQYIKMNRKVISSPSFRYVKKLKGQLFF